MKRATFRDAVGILTMLLPLDSLLVLSADRRSGKDGGTSAGLKSCCLFTELCNETEPFRQGKAVGATSPEVEACRRAGGLQLPVLTSTYHSFGVPIFQLKSQFTIIWIACKGKSK